MGVETTIGSPIVARDEDTVSVNGKIEFWENVRSAKCVMQSGKAPFQRASTVTSESIDLGTADSLGYVNDISNKLEVIGSQGMYSKRSKSKPTTSTTFDK